MFDLKTLNSALEQLETERGIPKAKIIEAIGDALAAAYKKDYGKKGQIIRTNFDLETGKTEFYQIKTVVNEAMVRMEDDEEEETEKKTKVEEKTTTDEEAEEVKPRFNPEQHILIEDARIIKKDAQLEEEMVFPLESKSDYGRIAAQTAKQVIIQRVREAERVSVVDEFEKRKGDIVSGTIQRIERGNVYIDLGRVIGVLPKSEQIAGEYLKQGDRVRAYLYAIEESPREITLKLSRSHPEYLHKLFELEVPEIANKVVEIKAIAREAGSRSKVAVFSHDEHIDPVGSCVGQRGIRVATIMNELSGEKIDIIEWSSDEALFVERALSPGQVVGVTLNEEEKSATINVISDQYSLAIGKGGQNARLAAKLTGWKIDIREVDSEGKEIVKEEKPEIKKNVVEETAEEEGPAPSEAPKDEVSDDSPTIAVEDDKKDA